MVAVGVDCRASANSKRAQLESSFPHLRGTMKSPEPSLNAMRHELVTCMSVVCWVTEAISGATMKIVQCGNACRSTERMLRWIASALELRASRITRNFGFRSQVCDAIFARCSRPSEPSTFRIQNSYANGNGAPAAHRRLRARSLLPVICHHKAAKAERGRQGNTRTKICQKFMEIENFMWFLLGSQAKAGNIADLTLRDRYGKAESIRVHVF